MVTCWTCHRGSAKPRDHASHRYDLRRRRLSRRPTSCRRLPADAGTPPADQILDKYIQALGGADRLSPSSPATPPRGPAICSARSTKTRRRSPRKRPNQLATLVHQEEGDLARTYRWPRGVGDAAAHRGRANIRSTRARSKAPSWTRKWRFPGGLKQFFTNWRVSLSDHSGRQARSTSFRAPAPTVWSRRSISTSRPVC